MKYQKQFLVQVCSIVLLAVFLAGCGKKAPASIDPKKTEWLDYSDVRTGYALKYPATYNIEPKGSGEIAVIGADKRVAYRVCYVDYETAKKRGLWVLTEPVATEYISGGRISHKYVYDYGNKLNYARTVAYVIEREGKMLALEFRLDSRNGEGILDPGQEEVLKSFIIL